VGVLVKDVCKKFGSFQAIDHVSLEIKTNSLVALLGPSGSGKSTLLRLIAGLELPDSGSIWLTDQEATYQRVQDRNIGFVFQHYALFKHMTIRQNIAFGLEIRKVPKARVRQRVEELLELVQLKGLGNRYPSQLSGGQRQRVGLARALAVEPKVLLLDEPFGALDAKVRKDLRAWLRRLHDEVHVTTIFVTHDQEEAMEVSHEIVVMNQGRIEQIATPAEIYEQPATPFVMSFIGPVNVLPNTAEIFQKNGFQAHNPQVFLRPHDVEIQTSPGENLTPAKVNRVIHLGWEVQVELGLTDGQVVTAYLTQERFKQLQLQPQQRVYVKPKQVKSFSFDHLSGAEYVDQVGKVKAVWLVLTDTYGYEYALKQTLEVAQHSDASLKAVFVIDSDAAGEMVNELEEKGWLDAESVPRTLQTSLLEGYHDLATDVLDKVRDRASQAGLLIETSLAEAPLESYLRGLLGQRGSLVIVSGSKALAEHLGELSKQVEWIEEEQLSESSTTDI
jgi:sulfate transport system ATP-binding protein